MATNITEYNATAGSNTSIDSINLQENQMVASDVNNAIRSLMSHLKNVDTGSQALTALSVTGALSCGAFTSQGIDDNADAVAITIDSSENVMISKTSTGFGTAGVELSQNGVAGKAFITRSGGEALSVNRLSSDGEIVGLYKDSSLVGSIGVHSGTDYFIGSGDTGIRFSPSNNCFIPYNTSGLASRDAGIDLGISSVRFKDLYLSGGVFLGGTGSANQMDSYEEGNWTPVLRGESGTEPTQGTTVSAKYVKIGQFVHIEARMVITTDNGGSGLEVAGLPFVTDGAVIFHLAETAVFGVVGIMFSNGSVASGSGHVTFREGNGSSAWQSGTYVQRTNGNYTMVGTYRTTS